MDCEPGDGHWMNSMIVQNAVGIDCYIKEGFEAIRRSVFVSTRRDFDTNGVAVDNKIPVWLVWGAYLFAPDHEFWPDIARICVEIRWLAVYQSQLEPSAANPKRSRNRDELPPLAFIVKRLWRLLKRCWAYPTTTRCSTVNRWTWCARDKRLDN